MISGKSGSGVTHLLQAVSNNYSNKKNVLFTNAQWMVYLIKQIKTDIELNKFQDHFLTFDIILIDNIQFFYKKSSRYSRFIIGLIKKCERINKVMILGCSEPGKDITKIKIYTKAFTIKKIELKPLNSESVFQLLKKLCEFEPSIPDKLLFVISGYNGSIQQYVNCLISIRFKSKVKNIDLHSLLVEEIEEQFRIEKYFSKQQFRKCFIQLRLNLWKEKVANVHPMNVSISNK